MDEFVSAVEIVSVVNGGNLFAPRSILTRAGRVGETLGDGDQGDELMTADLTVPVGFKTSSTILATLLAILLVIPGNYIGMAAVWVYTFFTNWGLQRTGGGGSWIPFFDGVFALVWGILLPQGLQTFVAVGLAVYGATWLFKRSDPTSVALTTAIVWTLCVSLFGLYIFSQAGWSIAILAFVASGMGVVVGAAVGRTAGLESR